jgi:hypothetical protein
MKHLYFKQDGLLWIKAKERSEQLDAEFGVSVQVEDDYDTMTVDSSITVEDGMPLARREKTRSEIESEISYATKRKAEYPPIEDYIDGMVKGDQAQIDAYISACVQVKNKYPKP